MTTYQDDIVFQMTETERQVLANFFDIVTEGAFENMTPEDIFELLSAIFYKREGFTIPLNDERDALVKLVYV